MHVRTWQFWLMMACFTTYGLVIGFLVGYSTMSPSIYDCLPVIEEEIHRMHPSGYDGLQDGVEL